MQPILMDGVAWSVCQSVTTLSPVAMWPYVKLHGPLVLD